METKTNLKIACVQTTSTDDVESNVRKVHRMINTICASETDLILLPENIFFLRDPSTLKNYSDNIHCDLIRDLCQKAKEYDVGIHIGSFPETIPDSDKIYNASMMIHPDGSIGPIYRKIHLFSLVSDGQYYRESDYTLPGKQAAADTIHGWVFGFSICYDVRFPELYRLLSKKGMDVALVPSAFTPITGPDHWEVLLRSRAIENQCYVIASAQCGQHNKTRHSYGHSMVIDPWGDVIHELDQDEGVIRCELSRSRLREVRSKLPALDDREFVVNFKNENS